MSIIIIIVKKKTNVEEQNSSILWGRTELDAANVGLALNRLDRVAHVRRPQLDLAVVTATGNQLGVNVIEVDAPAPLLVLLERLQLGADEGVPNKHASFVITAGEPTLEVRVPRHAADLRVANHLAVGIVDVDHVLRTG